MDAVALNLFTSYALLYFNLGSVTLRNCSADAILLTLLIQCVEVISVYSNDPSIYVVISRTQRQLTFSLA